MSLTLEHVASAFRGAEWVRQNTIHVHPAASGAFRGGGRASEFFGIFQEFDHAFEQTAGATTVNAAMIEA